MLDGCAAMALERIMRARETLAFRLHAWVIMPEHVHLLLSPSPKHAEMARILSAIKRPAAEAVIRRWRASGDAALGTIEDARGRLHFWQDGPGFDRNVRDKDEYARTVEYIHQNPVTRGLVARAEDWPWSSFRLWQSRDPAIDRWGWMPWKEDG